MTNTNRYFFLFFEVGRGLKFIWNWTAIHCALFYNGIPFRTMWTWCTNDEPIQSIQWRACWVLLVSTIHWNATNVYDFLIRHSKFRENDKLWRYHVWTRNIKKGIDFKHFSFNHKFQEIHFSFSDYQQSVFIFYDISKIQTINGSHSIQSMMMMIIHDEV